MIHEKGAEAATDFRIEKRFVRQGRRFTIVRALPQTGRTHQIRVHLSHLGHPIVGDKIYGPDERLYLRFIEMGWTNELERQLLLPRHALHSARLGVADLDWQSPLPADLTEWMEERTPSGSS
jgi:23S rRNA pseudouridine1911/1915/1917 synthase